MTHRRPQVRIIGIRGVEIPAGQDETIQFAIDGIGYTIDPPNAQAFRKSLDRYVEHATRTGRTTRARRAIGPSTGPDPCPAPSGNGPAPTDTRSSTEGRIPTDIVQAYHDTR